MTDVGLPTPKIHNQYKICFPRGEIILGALRKYRLLPDGYELWTETDKYVITTVEEDSQLGNHLREQGLPSGKTLEELLGLNTARYAI